MVQVVPGPTPQGTLVVDGFGEGDTDPASGPPLGDSSPADPFGGATGASEYPGLPEIGVGHAAPLHDEHLARQVRAADPDLATALFDRDPSWAPFFCPTCERAYCAEHWRGARCPYGHRQN